MIKLQPFEQNDFDRLINWIPDERFLCQWAGPIFRWPLDDKQLSEYLVLSKGEQPQRVIFKIFHKRDERIIGHIEIDSINWQKQTGILSRVLLGDVNYRGQGLGAKIVKQVLKHGFINLNLTEITLAVFSFNDSALACYKSLGFTEYEWKNDCPTPFGEKWDVIFMRIDKERWKDDTNNRMHRTLTSDAGGFITLDRREEYLYSNS